MAGRIQEIAGDHPGLRADRGTEVGQTLLHARGQQHRLNPRIQEILRAAVYERCPVKGPQGNSHPTNGERAGGAPDPVTHVREIEKLAPVLEAYIKEAIAVEKAGLEVTFKKTSEFKMPEEFQKKLNEMPVLKAAFEALTPGRQLGYLLYFSAAKQSKTRESRIEKCMDLIFDGKGLSDQ